MAAKNTWSVRITAVIVGVFGLPMVLDGFELLSLGGTPYYLVAGLLIVASAVQLWRKLPSGFYLYAAALILTLIWAVYEAGIGFWTVGVRIWLIGLISLWLCAPVIRRGLWGDDAPKLMSMPVVQVCALATVLLLSAMTYDLVTDDVLKLPDQVYGEAQNESDWTAWDDTDLQEDGDLVTRLQDFQRTLHWSKCSDDNYLSSKEEMRITERRRTGQDTFGYALGSTSQQECVGLTR